MTTRKVALSTNIAIPTSCPCGFTPKDDDPDAAKGYVLAHWKKEGVMAADRGGFTIDSNHPHITEYYIDPKGFRKAARVAVLPMFRMTVPRWLVVTAVGHLVSLSLTVYPGLLLNPLHHWANLLDVAWQFPEVSIPVVLSIILSFLMKDVRERIATLVAWIIIVTLILVALALVFAVWRWSNGV